MTHVQPIPAGTAAAVAPATMATALPAIATAGLRKTYRRRTVLHDLTLIVRPGEVFGFLGPNGAGKTTTIKILLGLVRPSAGQAQIFGLPAGSKPARRRLGYLPENFRFHEWLTGAALLDFHGRLSGVTAPVRRQRIPEVLTMVGLMGRGDERVGRYSKGMTQRLGLAQALLHRPDLVLLDEPTSALDPIGRREVREVIRTLRAEGITVFLNSHLLSEVEMVCDRAAIIDHGRVVGSGRLQDLVSGEPELRIIVDRVDRALLTMLESHARLLDVEDTTITLGVSSLEAAPRVASAIITNGYALHALVPVQRSLEEAFISLVEGTRV